MNHPLTPRGALAHHDAHTPGQRPLLAALVEWQSLAGTAQDGRFAGRPPNPSAEPEAPRGIAAAPGAVLRVAARELGWQPGTCPEWPQALGRLKLWGALPDSVEWIDLTLSVHRGGRWLALPVELADDPSGTDWLVPDPDLSDTLGSFGLAPEALRLALSSEATHCWMLRLDGLGAFIACAIDLGWPD
jgi:hypothetical protein